MRTPEERRVWRMIKPRMDELEALWRQRKRDESFLRTSEFFEEFGHHREGALYSARHFVKRANDKAKAIAVSTQAFERFPEPYPFSLMCLAYYKNGQNDEVLRLCERYLEDPELMGVAQLNYGGALLHRTGDFDGSVDYFHRASEFGDLRADQRPAAFCIRTEDFTALSQPDDPAETPIRFLGTRPVSVEAVIAASCDENYYRLFGKAYRDSFFKFNPNPAHILHFHVFDPGEALMAEIAADMAANPRIAFSIEHTAQNRGYYYAGRFFQMPRLMAHYGAPIVITDADCVFINAFDDLFMATAGCDIGVVDTGRTLFPWRNYVANLMVFNPTEEAARQALTMRNFLMRAPRDTFNFWYVDQLAIVEMAYAQKKSGAAKIVNVMREWERLCFQGSGMGNKNLEDKAARFNERAPGSGERRERLLKKRESSRES
jgi:hypothetical protein